MSVVAFDTHAAVTALREAGFDERQAEGVVATVRDAVVEGVATRADVDRLEDKMATGADVAEVKADVAEVKAELADVKADVAEVKAELADVKADVAEVKVGLAEVKADVAEMKVDVARLEGRVENEMATKADVARLETRMFLGILTAVGAVVALMKLLP